ncbi:pilus assembly protein [Bradyrhizobium sp. KBS0727]|uniref:TadE/TadG family type IV pilus assembly protein n=1 Tax=unclassified Bradyrhizobium TaxID=2631580 RepID=UPI00110D6894|nr:MULTISPECIES: TadE/TadG family type IV pilus assembly protein [unclassified Bradyrhizobium]QDW40181.1 pilus assembly protein [Bradyrhizobium sp. KBS0725]QDW46784.1 pilus assembly protein [Bradyrhizobium sp. KBS0727]
MTKCSSPHRGICRKPSLLRRLFDRAASDTGGAVAVEFGFLVPVLALMVVAVIDIGLGVYRKMQVEDAAQAGVQYAIMHNFDANAISDAVTSATNSTAVAASPLPVSFCGCATGSSISTVSCGTTCPGGALAGTYTTVSAQATYSTILNYQLVPSTYTYTAHSTARLQ